VQGDVRSQLVRAGSAVRGTPRQSGGWRVPVGSGVPAVSRHL